MGVEIERKFLVKRDQWPGTSNPTAFRQGYLSRTRGCTVRVRRAGDRAFLTVKGPRAGLVRSEYEYEIPVADADEMLGLCAPPLIDKHRHLVDHDGHTWEVDEFHGANAGLLVAEIELDGPDEAFTCPSWVGQEVTDDPRYLNANLVEHPFSEWGRP
jgi:CYTH domain-containing protein